MTPLATLSPAEQLIVAGARAADAVALWHVLHRLYAGRRGAAASSSAAPVAPAVNHTDAIDLVNAYERLAAPLAAVLARDAAALWAAWRRSYARVFEVVSAAPDLRAPLPAPSTLWFRLLRPFAEQLQTFAAARPTIR